MVETACPKDAELVKYLGREETRGRMIAFASFQGSLDRVKRLCQAEGWDVVMVDGRGWNCFKADGTRVKDHILDFWANNENKTVFVGNPASCRFGLTLTEAKTIVVFDQNFSAEHRLQSLDRNYRIGQDEEVEVIDLLHLPVDGLILDTLTENKRLEDLSLGLVLAQLGGESTDSEKVYDSV
jgi:SNF2 family DNA or RNA helicase